MEEVLMQNKKKKLYSAIKIFCFFFLLLVFIIGAGKITKRKESMKKYADFVELADQVDVLFFGSSHVMNSINPVQLFLEYGITGYNMGKSGGKVPESYWAFMNALDYCEPKCVVVDVWALDKDFHYVDTRNEGESATIDETAISFLHDSLDYLPLSKNKIAAVNDLIEDKETRKEFLWDFVLYHDRWSSLKEEDFRPEMYKANSHYDLGSFTGYEVVPNLNIFQVDKVDDVLPEDTASVQYLHKILDECEKRGIKAVITFFPLSESYELDWMATNTAEKIAMERGVPFLNMLPHDSQTVIQYKTDMFDSIHVNANGMRKVTSSVGAYLHEVLELEDHREDPEYIAWEEKAGQWQSKEVGKLLDETNLYIKLEMILNLNANAIIFLRGKSPAFQDSLVQEFLMQLSGTTSILEAADCNGPYLLVRTINDDEVEVQEYVGEMQIESMETILGDTNYIAMQPFSAIYVDGNQEYNYLDMEKNYESSVQIMILGQEGEIMQQFYVRPEWNGSK
ncbi:MAG: hypothetical protein IKW30_09860 [Lachnospiraceae bacterium]|nr:hypothetical protein [Lachnospiraceae bacterium]